MAINDTAQLAVIGTVLGQQHVHTLHFRHEQVGQSEADIINEWQAGCRTTYRTMFDNTDSPCQLYSARQVCGAVPLRAPAEEAEVAPNIVGASDFTSDAAPSWLAAVGSERTALAGRRRRGRFFIGGLYESEISGNNLVANHLARLQAYIDALMATFGESGTSVLFRLVVHSPTLAAIPGTECQNSSTPVTAIIARSAIGSMKSRKPGRGN